MKKYLITIAIIIAAAQALAITITTVPCSRTINNHDLCTNVTLTAGDVGALATGATISWGQVTSKPSFTTVATSGSYTDLINKPTLTVYGITDALDSSYSGSTGITIIGIVTNGTLSTNQTVTAGSYSGDGSRLTGILFSQVSGSVPDANIASSATWNAKLSTTGNAATASALAANGSNCSAGYSPLGVDTSGNSEGCWQVTPSAIGAASATINGTVTSVTFSTSIPELAVSAPTVTNVGTIILSRTAPVPVASGGTGTTSLPTGLLTGSGTGAIGAATNATISSYYTGSTSLVTGGIMSVSSLSTAGTVTAGKLVVDTNTLTVDSVNHRVGILTGSPANPFQVGTDVVAGAPPFKVDASNNIMAYGNVRSYSGFGQFQNLYIGNGSYGNSTIHAAGGATLNLQNSATEAFSLTSMPSTSVPNVFVLNATPSATQNLLQIQKNGVGLLTVDNGGSVIATSVTLTTGTEPTCNSGSRGKFWYVAGGAGVKDVVEVCGKDGADVYAWRAIY